MCLSLLTDLLVLQAQTQDEAAVLHYNTLLSYLLAVTHVLAQAVTLQCPSMGKCAHRCVCASDQSSH